MLVGSFEETVQEGFGKIRGEKKNKFSAGSIPVKTGSSPIVTWLLFTSSAAGYSDALGFGSRLMVDADDSTRSSLQRHSYYKAHQFDPI